MDISLKDKVGKRKGGFDEDSELTAQLNKTLADFEADLEDISHMDTVTAKEYPYGSSAHSNGVPVSVLDLVPITTIDEVPDYDYEHTVTHTEPKTLTRGHTTFSNGPSVAQPSADKAHNRNNNARSGGGGSGSSGGGSSKRVSDVTKRPPQATPAYVYSAGRSGRSASGVVKSERSSRSMERAGDAKTTGVKGGKTRQSEKLGMKSNPPVSKENDLPSYFPPKSPRTPPAVHAKEEAGEVPAYRPHLNNDIIATYTTSVSQSKITHGATSRFGLKTFTVVPPKHSSSSTTSPVVVAPAGTMSVGAIKIDEQGNMVQSGMWQKPGTAGPASVSGSGTGSNAGGESSQLLGKAKAFWSSSERQDGEKHKDNVTDQKKMYPTSPETTRSAKKPEDLRHLPIVKREPSLMAKPKEKDNAMATKADVQNVTESKAIIPEEPKPPSYNKCAPATTNAFLPNTQRDLSFLKPSRRTSSQYVASAITKYAKTDTMAPVVPETDRTNDNTAMLSSQKGGRSIQVIPRRSISQTVADRDQTALVAGPRPPLSRPTGPTRSASHPDYLSEMARGGEEAVWESGGRVVGSLSFSKGSTRGAESERVSGWPVVSPAPVRGVVSSDNRSTYRQSEALNPAATHSSPHLAYATKQGTAANLPASKFQVNSHTVGNTTTSTHPALATKLEPSVHPPPSGGGGGGGGGVGVALEPPPPVTTTVFGPMKKFKQVTSKPVQQEPCLHTALMEAIQTGGKDRLKKTPGTAPAGLKKGSQAEDENERSALLAAIRAQGSSGSLRQVEHTPSLTPCLLLTKSHAAEELQVFRKTSSGEEPPAFSLSRPSLSPPPSSFGLAPPPPPGPPGPPPAPPSLLRSGGASGGAADSQGNPAVAREAMLEAIRSGSAAGKLKKITAPVKTVQVNGRLGTIRAGSFTLAHQ